VELAGYVATGRLLGVLLFGSLVTSTGVMWEVPTNSTLT
jgi:hypothetical protein